MRAATSSRTTSCSTSGSPSRSATSASPAPATRSPRTFHSVLTDCCASRMEARSRRKKVVNVSTALRPTIWRGLQELVRRRGQTPAVDGFGVWGERVRAARLPRWVGRGRGPQAGARDGAEAERAQARAPGGATRTDFSLEAGPGVQVGAGDEAGDARVPRPRHLHRHPRLHRRRHRWAGAGVRPGAEGQRGRSGGRGGGAFSAPGERPATAPAAPALPWVLCGLGGG